MKKVAAYCRVSTDQEDQKHSLSNQMTFFKHYINKNTEWELSEIYADEGLSGTSVRKRKAFNQMIADAEDGKFDLLLTKEISRFARNTLDSIYYTRLLKEKNIGVYFINDNINTLDPDSELRLTIMAGIAQEESRKISDRVKWGQHRSMENGVVFGARVYGYHLTGGKLTVNENEAETVRLIFDKYIHEGKGAYLIAKDLDEMGIAAPTGINHWTHATIFNILKNEKYTGLLKQKKQITADYLNHSRKRNEGEELFVIIENNHPAIISQDMFNNARDEIAKRRNHPNKAKYSNKYCFSGKLICGRCGARFIRRSGRRVWQCGTSIRYGKERGCDNASIRDEILEKGFLTALERRLGVKQDIIQDIEKIVFHTLSSGDNSDIAIKKLQSQLKRYQNKLNKLTDLYLDNLIAKDDFHTRKILLNRQIEANQADIALMCASQQPSEDETQIKNIHTAIVNMVKLKEFHEEICKAVLTSALIMGREDIRYNLDD